MPTTSASLIPARRLLGATALILAAGGLAAAGICWTDWSIVAFSSVVAAAGVGLARRSMVTQILSRATAWLLLAPSALIAVGPVMAGHPLNGSAAALALGSGAALVLARPMLDTREARTEFDPVAYRRWLAAAATASVAAGFAAGAVGLDAVRWGDTASGLGLCALGVALIASAIGVVRMRAWGVILGVATSLAAILASIALADIRGVALSFLAIPGLMLGLPVLLAKGARDRHADLPHRVRVDTTATETAPTKSLRVALSEGERQPEDADLIEPGSANAGANAEQERRARRAMAPSSV